MPLSNLTETSTCWHSHIFFLELFPVYVYNKISASINLSVRSECKKCAVTKQSQSEARFPHNNVTRCLTIIVRCVVGEIVQLVTTVFRKRSNVSKACWFNNIELSLMIQGMINLIQMLLRHTLGFSRVLEHIHTCTLFKNYDFWQHKLLNYVAQEDDPRPDCAKWPFISLNHNPANSPSLTRQMPAASGRWCKWKDEIRLQ